MAGQLVDQCMLLLCLLLHARGALAIIVQKNYVANRNICAMRCAFLECATKLGIAI